MAQNVVVYDLLLEQTWRAQPESVDTWVRGAAPPVQQARGRGRRRGSAGFARARYGPSSVAENVWSALGVRSLACRCRSCCGLTNKAEHRLQLHAQPGGHGVSRLLS
jgi:hypothetical protein